jgi:hypothetical protein
MTRDGWREVVLVVLREYQAGDTEAIEDLVRLLEEQDYARNVLRKKGYGVTGTPWPDTVAEVRDADYVRNYLSASARCDSCGVELRCLNCAAKAVQP